MKKVVLLTRDKKVRDEFSAALPKGCKVLSGGRAFKNSIIFFDTDTQKAGQLRELSGANFVISVTGKNITGPVMEAAASGAYETLKRPINPGDILRILDELTALREEMRHTISVENLPPTATCAIVGQSPNILDVCKKIARLAQVEAPVLITGETGTGKELVAESITQFSSRFGKPFVVVNCAAVPETLLESELFGFEKGAFTGAVSSKEGMLKIADGGCVFFDEVGELPLSLQGKLLRFLQTQTFYPIGSTREVQVNVRVISATNRELSLMVREGRFREDLYHRLSVTTVHVPPLRERKEDILSLLYFFIGRYKHTAPRDIKGITKAFFKKMVAYDWPGNIRELENAVRSAIALSKTDYLTTHELKDVGGRQPSKERKPISESMASAVIPLLKEAMQNKEKNIYEKIHNELDKPLLNYILSYTKENQSEAARILGINRLTLRKKLKY